jgi:pantothenate kinase
VEAGRTITIDELARQVLERAKARSSARYVLGIAGPPGAGKSTLAERLRDGIRAIAGEDAVEIAPMDGFHLPNAELALRGWTHQKGEPHTFDVDGYVEILRALRRSGEDVAVPVYDRTRHEPRLDGARFSANTTIVITEGNYLLLDVYGWSDIRSCLDEAWFLDADRALLAQRLYARHVDGGKTPDVARQKVEISDLANAEIVASSIDRADLVLVDEGGTYRLRKPYDGQ